MRGHVSPPFGPSLGPRKGRPPTPGAIGTCWSTCQRPVSSPPGAPTASANPWHPSWRRSSPEMSTAGGSSRAPRPRASLGFPGADPERPAPNLRFNAAGALYRLEAGSSRISTCMVWPDFFPTGCPHSYCEPASGRVYRLVESQPPAAKDFLSHRERFPSRQFNVSECQVCGLSVYRSLEDAEALRRRIPAMKNRRIARGFLEPELGVVHHTPSNGDSHHTWWMPVGVTPWETFTVLPDGEGGG